MTEPQQDFECDYCDETHTMTLTEMELHLAERFMQALMGANDDSV